MKIKTILAFLLISFVINNSYGQIKTSWKDIIDIYAKEVIFSEKNPAKAIKGQGKSLKDIEGKKISITGYFLDLDPDGEWFMISKNPFATCFFCGGAGPETVLELMKFKNDKQKFKTDDIVTATGTIKLITENEVDVSFILLNPTVKHLN
ncbi:hypothetical protein GCM10011416_06090 [Polaribacter pacificus]|uniref:DUF3299 domain-containing protein n=1 Tax=Polaribacter pacificus TaxID=1775173 RepID=A0A917MCL7_9FLAO|nr:hypothetical protein [Polaribacter pacificus]GGG92049.1 hypothetical protein GCM10011416_06090 [Polaribacter pacificus]